MSVQFSISPAGEKFPLPKPEDYKAEFDRLKKLTEKERAKGREIVVVMGVGFVGAVMAAIVADTVDKKTGKPSKSTSTLLCQACSNSIPGIPIKISTRIGGIPIW